MCRGRGVISCGAARDFVRQTLEYGSALRSLVTANRQCLIWNKSTHVLLTVKLRRNNTALESISNHPYVFEHPLHPALLLSLGNLSKYSTFL